MRDMRSKCVVGWRRVPLGIFLAVWMFAGAGFESGLYAQPSAPVDLAKSGGDATPEARLAALSLEMTNAYQGVLRIVNQPVKAYVRSGNIDVSVFSPGWFHPGATKPDFNTVDIRQSQEFPYAKNKFAASDVTPGLVFLGEDLEFNSMTKYFYTNRALPKHKLSEAQMIEVNRLYRIIGRCEDEINRLQAPPATATQTTTEAVETETVVPGQSFESIRAIPKQTRILYGSGAIGVLVVVVIALRLLRKNSG